MENKVLAVVEGREITEQDLHLLMQGLGQRAMQFSSEEGRKQLINELVTQELFLVDSKDKNYEEDKEYQEELEKVTENFTKQYAIAKLLKAATVEEDEAVKFYDEHKSMYKVNETVRASHILVDSEEKAKAVMGEIEGGKSFEEAAQEHSSCPSSAKGGDLGSFDQGKMVPEFEEAVFSMNVDEVRGPVQTQFGYHIIKVTDKKPAGEKTYDEVKEQIKGQLVAMKQNKLYLEESERLRSEYKVEIK